MTMHEARGASKPSVRTAQFVSTSKRPEVNADILSNRAFGLISP